MVTSELQGASPHENLQPWRDGVIGCGNQFTELRTPFLQNFEEAIAQVEFGKNPEATVGLGDAAICGISNVTGGEVLPSRKADRRNRPATTVRVPVSGARDAYRKAAAESARCRIKWIFSLDSIRFDMWEIDHDVSA